MSISPVMYDKDDQLRLVLCWVEAGDEHQIKPSGERWIAWVDTSCHIGGYASGKWSVQYEGYPETIITAPSWVCSVTGDKYLYPAVGGVTKCLEDGCIVYIEKHPGLERTPLDYDICEAGDETVVADKGWIIPTEGDHAFTLNHIGAGTVTATCKHLVVQERWTG